MLNLAINRGGVQQITPSGSLALEVVINGSSYSTAFDTNVATTLDNWIAAHAEAVSKKHSVYAADGTSTLNLYNVDVIRTLTAPNATIGARAEITNAGSIPLDDSTRRLVSATVVVDLNEDVPAGYDVATFTFASASEAKRGLEALDEFVINASLRATGNNREIEVPCLVVLS